MSEAKPIWADPDHPTNRIRPRIICVGCGTRGCVTRWGPWCFDCNVKRMTHLNASFGQIQANLDRLEAAEAGAKASPPSTTA